MGPFNMDLENRYVSDHKYTTTSVNTTGLIVSGENKPYDEHVVNFQTDNSREGISGTYVSFFLKTNRKILKSMFKSISTTCLRKNNTLRVFKILRGKSNFEELSS